MGIGGKPGPGRRTEPVYIEVLLESVLNALTAGITIGCIYGLMCIGLGLIFGIIALVQISSSATPQEGRSLAIAGLILSATNLLWCFGLTAFNLASNQAHLIQNFN